MKYFLSVAGIPLEMDIPVTFEMNEDMRPFLSEKTDEIREHIRFVPELKVPSDESGIWNGLSLFYGQNVFRYRKKSELPYAYMDWDQKICYYDPERPQSLWNSQCIWNAIGLETLLIRHQRLLMHCSFIRHERKAILFSAPSGTGKSTQAELWHRYAGADILNGDRAALSCKDGKWTAWGLPFAGSSGIYRNEFAPLDAIVILRQGKKNQIRKLDQIQSMTALYPEINLHRWDSDFINTAMNQLMNLIQTTDIYLLECLPDEGAVKLLQKTLLERRK